MRFSPDTENLIIASASEDRTVKLWKEDGTLIKTFNGHTDKVRSISFSTDGKTLVSASDDKTVILWDFDKPLNLSLQDLISRGCKRLYNYLKTNDNVRKDSKVCD